MLRILDASGAPLAYDFIEIGESTYLSGHSSGMAPESWDVLRGNQVFLKAPITTPLGGGFKSLNVTIRKSLNLFANVRPTKSYAPSIRSAHPEMDVVGESGRTKRTCTPASSTSRPPRSPRS